MKNKIICNDCRYQYHIKKKTPKDIGDYHFEYINVPKCKKGHRILVRGMPGCVGKEFEPKEK